MLWMCILILGIMSTLIQYQIELGQTLNIYLIYKRTCTNGAWYLYVYVYAYLFMDSKTPKSEFMILCCYIGVD